MQDEVERVEFEAPVERRESLLQPALRKPRATQPELDLRFVRCEHRGLREFFSGPRIFAQLEGDQALQCARKAELRVELE